MKVFSYLERPQVYKGLDLLDCVLEFQARVPDQAQWDFSSLQPQTTQYVLLKQIVALFNAFYGKPISFSEMESIKSFLKGDFLKRLPLEDYKEVLMFMQSINRRPDPEYLEASHELKLIVAYERLVRFRALLKELIDFNRDVLAAGIVSAGFALMVTMATTEKLEDEYKDIDHALELFINPYALEFTEEELKDKYDFPIETLEQYYWI